MTPWTQWWVWLIVAFVFGGLEVLLPAFVFLGFAGGAVALAGLVALGLDLGVGWTLVAFALLSGAAYGALRLALGRQGGQVRIVRRDINED